MATKAAVNAGSKFCRDCGGPIPPAELVAWCPNTTTHGHQQISQDHCRNLSRDERRFCEECGQPVSGIIPCRLKHKPSTP